MPLILGGVGLRFVTIVYIGKVKPSSVGAPCGMINAVVDFTGIYPVFKIIFQFFKEVGAARPLN